MTEHLPPHTDEEHEVRLVKLSPMRLGEDRLPNVKALTYLGAIIEAKRTPDFNKI